MDLLITIGLMGVLTAVASFLFYYLSRPLNKSDARRVDPVPPIDSDEKS